MTHDELLAKIDEPNGEFDAGDPTRHHLLLTQNKALRAVVELHKPWPCAQDCCFFCKECDEDSEIAVVYPCPTIQQIIENLK